MSKPELIWKCKRPYGGYVIATMAQRKAWVVAWFKQVPDTPEIALTQVVVHVDTRDKARELSRWWVGLIDEPPLWLPSADRAIVEQGRAKC